MNDMAVKPFKIGQYVMMSEEGLRNHGEKYRNVVFKIDDVCPIDFNSIGTIHVVIILSKLGRAIVNLRTTLLVCQVFDSPIHNEHSTNW